MVKHMKKAKISAQASLGGVLTRAKTMALKKSKLCLSTSTMKENLEMAKGGDDRYLQLRSRRVERKKAKNDKKDDDGEEDGSVGDNCHELESENVERNIREHTPNSSIVVSGITKTPSSSNKAAANAYTVKKARNIIPRVLIAQDGSPRKLEEYFAREEKKHIERFIKKYNFDPVHEKPLEGRYEWVELKP